MLAGAFIIAAISLCILLIAGNALVRGQRRRERSTNDWERHCTDGDCGLLKILNSVHHGKAD